jgi:HSP20 family protein
MNLIRFNQHPAFSNLFENFENSAKTNFSNSCNDLPMVNIQNEDNSFIVKLAAPGMEKDDFKIKLENNRLTIASEKEEEKTETNETYTLKEFNFNSFSRSFSLPKNIEFEQINAEYKNGILSVKLPKKEMEAKLNREIEIS